MIHPPELGRFLSGLAERYAPAVRLGHRGFLQLLEIVHFPRNLKALLGGRVVCDRVEVCCRPIMNKLCPDTPGEGWLAFCYAALCARLFPSPHIPAPEEAQTQAMDFLLDTLSFLLASEAGFPHDPLLDICWPTEDELSHSPTAGEFRTFRGFWENHHILALLHLGRYCTPFDPAGHIIGVNNVSVHLARLSRQAGLSVDIPLVCAAALGHDLGKFGCRGEEARRTARLHYYYTWQVLAGHGLTAIGHTAANHSTWDLEWENLPMASLLLIYADFRVRGRWMQDGREEIQICTLDEAYDRILAKLEDLTPEKRRRYATVYTKLRDFEDYLVSRGVNPELTVCTLQPHSSTPPSLTTGDETLQALRHLATAHSLRLMESFSNPDSFSRLLEQARGEKNLRNIRTYLLLFEEYGQQMPQSGKRNTLSLLYELLMHPEGDVRRRAATIMGHILGDAGPTYRKELPPNAPATACAPAMVEHLPERTGLWQTCLLRCLRPEKNLSGKHARRITDSLKVIAGSLFSCCTPTDGQSMGQCLLPFLRQAEDEEKEVLLEVLGCIPAGMLKNAAQQEIFSLILPWFNSPRIPVRLSGLRYLEKLLAQCPGCAQLIAAGVAGMATSDSFALHYARNQLLAQCGQPVSLPRIAESRLFLENLKNAVHWRVKLVHLRYLRDKALAEPATAFHTATHLANLLSVSEHLPVRECAGQMLLELCHLLSTEQRNELLVDLTRELETGQEQVSHYVAPVLGRLLCQMPDQEMGEGLDYLSDLIGSSGGRAVKAAVSALHTLGAVLSTPEDRLPRESRRRCLSLLMLGVAHYDPTIHTAALGVLCREVLGCPEIPLALRRDDLILVGKKLLCMLTPPAGSVPDFYHRAAMLNHLYRLLVVCRVEGLTFPAPAPKPVAFFPGTFDPFSLGHKEIVRAVSRLGYQVYLAIDEFSWSKRTIPRLLRRKIAAMSVSDLWEVYLYPDELPVNLADPASLSAMSAQFPGRTVTLVVGSDVIANASAYGSEVPQSVRWYDHVVFCRGEDKPQLSAILRGKVQILDPPDWCRGISSTRIRAAVDQALDISAMVDPVVQSFIYANGLYLHSPAQKSSTQTGDIHFLPITQVNSPLPAPLSALMSRHPEATALCLCRQNQATPLGWVCGHGVKTGELLFALGSPEASSRVRAQAVGRIFLVDGVSVLEKSIPNARRLLVKELLARSLQAEYGWALCRCGQEDGLREELEALGFCPVPGQPELLQVNLTSPLVLIEDVAQNIKPPLRADPEVQKALRQARQKLYRTLNRIRPGHLLLPFDAGLLAQAISRRVQGYNPAQSGDTPLGQWMCVPCGAILSGEAVPHTVTKTLHSDKVYTHDLQHFTITQAPGYPPLSSQIRTLGAFGRPVILVDDLLHRRHRFSALDPMFQAEGLDIRQILVGILSGHGRDSLLSRGREVDCLYYIPNLHLVLRESNLYPYLGGYSIAGGQVEGILHPGINPILPYARPEFLRDEDGFRLSQVALENARDILQALEKQHLFHFSTAMTIGRMGGAVYHPRLPHRGKNLRHDLRFCPSDCVEDDLTWLKRIASKEVTDGL